MKKILLFGLTKDLKVYLENIRNLDVDVMGVIGRNHEVKQKEYCGLPIFSIEDIVKTNYEEIHVLPSSFKSIKQELILRGIDTKNIVAPAKSLLHNHLFVDVKISNFAEQFISDISARGVLRDINIFVDAGTLLGFARDGKLIKWDNDIDFSICEKDINVLISILDELSINTYRMFYERSEGVISGYVSYNSTNIPFDFYVRRFEGNVVVNLSENFLSTDSIHFLDSDLVQINQDHKVLFPKHHKKYLESVYGPSWLVPNLEFSFADYISE